MLAAGIWATARSQAEASSSTISIRHVRVLGGSGGKEGAWREKEAWTEGWQQADFERDKQFVAEQKLAHSADEVFVNGDSFIPNARALEPIFKVRVFAPVEAWP